MLQRAMSPPLFTHYGCESQHFNLDVFCKPVGLTRARNKGKKKHITAIMLMNYTGTTAAGLLFSFLSNKLNV